MQLFFHMRDLHRAHNGLDLSEDCAHVKRNDVATVALLQNFVSVLRAQFGNFTKFFNVFCYFPQSLEFTSQSGNPWSTDKHSKPSRWVTKF